jgi:hypothetical protein
MSIPIWVTDPTGNNDPYLKIVSHLLGTVTGTLEALSVIVDQLLYTIRPLQTINMVYIPGAGVFPDNIVVHGTAPTVLTVPGVPGSFSIYTRGGSVSGPQTISVPIFGQPQGGGAEQSFGTFTFTWNITSVDLRSGTFVLATVVPSASAFMAPGGQDSTDVVAWLPLSN